VLAHNPRRGDKTQPEQKAQTRSVYRSIAPELAADRGGSVPAQRDRARTAEIARLEGLLNATTPALDAGTEGVGASPDRRLVDGGGRRGEVGRRHDPVARGGRYSPTAGEPATDKYKVVVKTTPAQAGDRVRIEA